MKTRSIHTRFTFIFLALFILGLTGCEEFWAGPPKISQCTDLLGTWASPEYDALKVSADNTHSSILGITMMLDINEQNGCSFSGSHTWGNGNIGGTEHLAGLLDPDTGSITMIEIGLHPNDGTTGRMVGRLTGDRITIEYTGIAKNGTQGNVFSTIVTRGGSTTERESCPDISGTWNSSEYQAMAVNADGSTFVMEGLTMSLEVAHQEGCTFRGINNWSNGEISGKEPVAGVLHSDGSLVTIFELPPHPEDGATGLISARLNSSNDLDWTYIAKTADGTRSIVFSTSLSQSGSAPTRQACPNLLGDWKSGPFEMLRVYADGTTQILQRNGRELEVDHQEGCLIMGTNNWFDDAGTRHTEPMAGIIDGEAGIVTIMELNPHPADGSTAIITERIMGADQLFSSYTGYASDDSYAGVFSLVLTRE
jgi:hypothetical protein